LPPLRERPEDLPLLVETLLHDLNKKHGCRIDGVDPEVLDLFRQHSWPGNVRELRNVLERAVILAGEGMITSKNLPNNLGSVLGLSQQPAVEPGTVRLPVGTTIGEAEKAMILKTLEHTGNNKTRAAAILGISQKTMFNKLKEYGADTRNDAPDET
jgi:transcriptional regulator with PAS, ATPase and Fis domain